MGRRMIDRRPGGSDRHVYKEERNWEEAAEEDGGAFKIKSHPSGRLY